ncbi:MAG: acetylornithine transaminase [Gammaproteobacteria bacterium]|nr:MAG: acetylornithine transaminase [Gammaproteobacteria bacterium]
MTSDALMNNYGKRPLSLVKGEGAWVWDDNGKRYLDALAGIAVCGLGHAHPAVTEAIHRQSENLVHCSNLYNIPAQERLAEQLKTVSGMTNMFFSNSGAEANEAAIKLARLHGHSKNIDVPTIIVMENSFHGRTLATLTATGNRKVHAGFKPLVRGFARAPFDDLEAVHAIAANNDSIAAILVEPIQGEGGIRIPDDDYLIQLRNICDANDWLLMLDEIQTANGRTGSFFHYQQHNIRPDVVTIAKGLGNGMPIGTCLASGPASQLMQPGSHGSTFGGNPVACAAAEATIATIDKDKLCQRADELGTLLLEQFRDTLTGCDMVKEIRGRGLMIGIELTEPCSELVGQAADAGLLINVTANNVIRLLPPLIFSDDQARQLISTLVPLIKAFSPEG